MTLTKLLQRALATGHGSSVITLHGFPTSSTTFMTRFALNIKGAHFNEESVPIVMRDDGRPDAVGTRPCLEAQGRKFEGTWPMLHYVEEQVSGPSLYPSDPLARAQVHAIIEQCSCEVAPFGFYRVQRYLEDVMGLSVKQSKQWQLHWLQHGFEGINELLEKPEGGNPAAPGSFCVGDAPTLADVYVLPLVHWSQRDTISRVDLSPYPTLQRIYRQSLKHPAFRNSLPEKQVSWKD